MLSYGFDFILFRLFCVLRFLFLVFSFSLDLMCVILLLLLCLLRGLCLVFALRFCSVVVDGRAANAYFINETLLRISLELVCECKFVSVFVDVCLWLYKMMARVRALTHSLHTAVSACLLVYARLCVYVLIVERIFIVNALHSLL